ncbi:hypothetical protein BGX29_009487 [Mortierella sp. GBA35]|nr:hypothetical protein BGX29_009487 [Mortierella sp. GBA35]
MSRPSYFETGTHHVLCKIAGLDPKEFPYPQDFQDCWDHHHVRLACSSRPSGAAAAYAWPEVVQGLTAKITTSKQLSEILSRWNEGDPRGWNIDALEAFLNKKADRGVVSAATPSSATSTSSAVSSPDVRLQINDEQDTEEQATDTLKEGDGEDIIMSDVDHQEADDNTTASATATSTPRSFVSWDHNEETAEDQFLTREERDRFFNVILPGMQELALRLPELVKRPIPFLKQQQDSAITLSQEQIACLLANAFFCTFPCRNAPNQYANYSNTDRKRLYSDQSDGRTSGKRDNPSANRVVGGGRGGGAGAGRTLEGTPRDPHGAAAARAKKQASVSSSTDPYRNTDGQLSLFAYFKKEDPKPSSRSDSSRQPANKDGHRLGGAQSSNTGAGNGGDGAVKTEDLSGHVKESAPSRESAKETQTTWTPRDSGNESTRRPTVAAAAAKDQRPSFPRYPSINFSSLFYSDDIRNPCTSTNAAKLRCILHYFDRVLQQMPSGVVTFHRQVLNEAVTLDASEMLNQAPFFRYSNVRIESDSPLEDDAPLGALQLDFANKVIGGGVLGRGAVQEEIRFAICPELIVSRLFTQMLQSNEALLIKGAERFSNYNGYANTFEWHSNHIDTTPRDKLGRRRTEICAIDALPFKSGPQRLDQFCESAVLRELNKAIAGFRRSPITSSDWGLCQGEVPSPRGDLIATGNWGCGAFGGHLQLKFLIQLLAASVCAAYSRVDDGDDLGRDLIYFTYGLDELSSEIQTFMAHLHASPQVFEPSRVLECIIHYPIKSSRGDIVALRNKSLLDFVSASFGFPTSFNNSNSTVDTQSTLGSMSWTDNTQESPYF